MGSQELTVSLPEGFAFLGLDETGSTSDHARAIAENWFATHEDALWIWTNNQTKGRGRRGRTWISSAGNLTATLLMSPKCTASKAAELSFVSALAVADLLGEFANYDQIKLKWPNDVLLTDKKIAGILLESAGTSTNPVDWVSIGVGVNLVTHPADTPYLATSLKDYYADQNDERLPPHPILALEVLANRFDTWLSIWRDSGFSAIKDSWLDRAKGLGEPIVVNLSDKKCHGVFVGLDQTGALILDTPDGNRQTISAGEVHFGPPA